jgi:hypothetical protein
MTPSPLFSQLISVVPVKGVGMTRMVFLGQIMVQMVQMILMVLMVVFLFPPPPPHLSWWSQWYTYRCMCILKRIIFYLPLEGQQQQQIAIAAAADTLAAAAESNRKAYI